MRPISAHLDLSSIASNDARGKLRNSSILLSNMKYVSRNARSILSRLPLTAAGSTTPQFVVTGRPGQTGQDSLAGVVAYGEDKIH